MRELVANQRSRKSSCSDFPDFRSRSFILPVALLNWALLWAGSVALCQAPKTRRKPVQENIHGIQVIDPYRWLEDRHSPETQEWIKAQDAYTVSILGSLPGRDVIKRRLEELLRVDSFTLPVERSGHYFFMERSADQELPVLLMRKGLQGPDEVLIDPHPMSPDRSVSVNLLDVCKDGGLLAYGVRQGGQDEVAIELFDVASRKRLPGRLKKARYLSVSFKADCSGFFYSRQDPEGPGVYYHELGKDSNSDTQVFGEGYGTDKIIAASVSDDGRYLLIHVFYGAGADTTEIHIQDLKAQGPMVPVIKGLAARFAGDIGKQTLFVQTNWKAPNGRVLAVDLDRPSPDQWREVIPESDAVMDDMSLASGRLFVSYLKNVRSSLRIFEPDGRPVREVPLPSLGSISGVSGRWNADDVFFKFSSFRIPPLIYHYSAAKDTREAWAQPKIPIRAEDLELEQVWVESKDHTRVPMVLLRAKAIQMDGSHPVLLTGYGGFNVSETPAFRPEAALWAEIGGVFALAILRGGGEFGEAWHRGGMLGNKQNVFDDFIAAANWLVQRGYTSPSKLAVTGKSNGGLLVGAALTQRPDLFQAAVCEYPLLDMVRYHKFLVAQFWVSEYGSSDDPDQFKYLLAYSPYHHVTPGVNYPAVLFETGDGDTRVDPLHARKMCALLQSATASDRPVLIRYDSQAGHTGAEPLSKRIAELTDELSFLFWQLRVSSFEKIVSPRPTS